MAGGEKRRCPPPTHTHTPWRPVGLLAHCLHAEGTPARAGLLGSRRWQHSPLPRPGRRGRGVPMGGGGPGSQASRPDSGDEAQLHPCRAAVGSRVFTEAGEEQNQGAVLWNNNSATSTVASSRGRGLVCAPRPRGRSPAGSRPASVTTTARVLPSWNDLDLRAWPPRARGSRQGSDGGAEGRGAHHQASPRPRACLSATGP